MTSIWFIAGLLLAVIFWLRLGPDNRDRWHIDPADREDARRGEVRLIGLDAPRFPADAATVLQRFKSIADAEQGTRLLDGSLDEGMLTYVAFSWIIFRDYITVKAVDEVGQAKLAVLSRPRFNWQGRRTNAARLDRWLLQTQQTLGG